MNKKRQKFEIKKGKIRRKKKVQKENINKNKLEYEYHGRTECNKCTLIKKGKEKKKKRHTTIPSGRLIALWERVLLRVDFTLNKNKKNKNKAKAEKCCLHGGKNKSKKKQRETVLKPPTTSNTWQETRLKRKTLRSDSE